LGDIHLAVANEVADVGGSIDDHASAGLIVPPFHASVWPEATAKLPPLLKLATDTGPVWSIVVLVSVVTSARG
jgi:hypothetical protein